MSEWRAQCWLMVGRPLVCITLSNNVSSEIRKESISIICSVAILPEEAERPWSRRHSTANTTHTKSSFEE